MKTKKLIENENRRVEHHKANRENAIRVATDRKALLILQERKNAKNEKIYKSYLKEQGRDLKDRMEVEKQKG